MNNVLGFLPYSGELSTLGHKAINEEMKLAAVYALAELAREDVPEIVSEAYDNKNFFGPDYIIPKPFDPRVLIRVAPAVAKAMETGVAQQPIEDFEEYIEKLEALRGFRRGIYAIYNQSCKVPGTSHQSRKRQ